jgi:hypothetical protein
MAGMSVGAGWTHHCTSGHARRIATTIGAREFPGLIENPLQSMHPLPDIARVIFHPGSEYHCPNATLFLDITQI